MTQAASDPLSGWKTQRFSDVATRDGFGVELLGPNGNVVAEVFASDGPDASFTLAMYETDVPVIVVEWFLCRARSEIAHFTDGRPLPSPVRTT